MRQFAHRTSLSRASRYSRYDVDRRSRSPRDRSPDRFDRASHYSDGDRRRSSAEARSNSSAFQSNRDGFGDQLRREPPRGPKALIDPPSGPRGGGFVGDFRGGRGRGRGRGWPGRDDSRDRGRDRDMDYRDRYRDERSRERDRERDRDWRESRDLRSRRSPIGRARSPTRDFRDRERDLPPGVDADRSRRGSRDGGPPSAGSASSEPLFGMGAPFPRGGGFIRGRGRGGRGDWPAERGRGRVPYDDRGDRYSRTRSQEGRWGRERDERDRGDRYPDIDPRRDPRDERDRGDRELFRAKMEARVALENASQAKEISPPPVAPSAPAFGSVPNRAPSTGDGHAAAAGGTGKLPPTAPRAFVERPVSAGHSSAAAEPPPPPTGPSKSIHDSPPIPLGPRAQQQKQQRPSSKQWINPNLKKLPESPKVMRSQSFAQQRPVPFQGGGSQSDMSDPRRPRSSDTKSDSYTPGLENRMRSHHSAEPGEITSRPEDERPFRRESIDHRREWMDHHEPRFFGHPRGSAGFRASSPPLDPIPRVSDNRAVGESKQHIKAAPKHKRKAPAVGAVRFTLPPKSTQQGEPSESDDEDMGDYFANEIIKEEAELSKLQKPSLPTKVISRFMAMSHGSMVRIMNDGEGLLDMFGDISEGRESIGEKMDVQPTVLTQPQDTTQIPGEPRPSQTQEAQESTDETVNTEPVEIEKDEISDEPEPTTEKKDDDESQLKAEEMDIDDEKARVHSEPENPTDAVDDAAAQVVVLEGAEEPAAVAAEDNQVHADQPTSTLETENGSKPPSTPSQVEDEEDDDETESEDETYMDVGTVRQYMTTPPIDSLPDYGGPAWDKDKGLLETLESDSMIDEFVAEHLRKIHLDRTAAKRNESKVYAGNYIGYLGFTMSDDPVAVKSRDKFSVSAPSDANGTSTPEQKPEGRGSGRRFATERDLERVLQASMREDEERKERELRLQQEKKRSDKEAMIPDMHWDEAGKQEAQYTDRSGYIPPDRLVSAWHVLPPVNNLTEEETQPFEKRYLEFPKQWGKIAEVIANRDFGTCIQFYYLMKKELNLKEKLKKQPKRRKKGGRGKQRSSALVSELGNGEPEGEETQENGENGERRRPRRAAAPTWGFEQPPTDGESTSATATPGRRGASAAAKADQPEKVDGRKGRRKAAKDKDKDKDAKTPKPNQTLAAAPAVSAGKGRSRADSRPINAEFQASATPDPHRMPTQFDQQLPPGIQPPPFAVQQQQPIPSIERPKPATATSIAEVMAAPSLRPEPLPPPQSSMTTFNLAQPPPERKAPTQASSYWSVSEANDFPLLLRAFGSDWTAIATHMGSKTAVMVKNYFVRQKDNGKMEWEAIVQEADAKRARGEKRPDPPQPTTGGRGRRYDAAAPSTSRPLAVAPGADSHDPSQPKMEPAPAQPSRAQPFSSYGVPIAQAPVQQPLAHSGQQAIAMQPHSVPHSVPQSAAQTMSPSVRPLRPPPPFGFTEREREPSSQSQPQRIPLPHKAPTSQVPDLRDPRPLAAAQQMQSAHSEVMVERMNMEKRLREQHQQHQQQKQHQQLRERERELARQAEQSMRVKQEPEAPPPQHHYEPFVGHHRQQSSHGGGPREPFSMTRPPSQDPSRSAAGQPYPPPVQQQTQQMRSLLSDPSAVQSPQLAQASSRSLSNQQPRQSSGSTQEPYGAAQPQPAGSMPPLTPVRPPEPRKSNIMSLLNEDPPPPPKRVSEVLINHAAGPSPPPQSQGIGCTPPQMRREPEYSPYGRTVSGGASAMPSLKPTYTASPGSSHMSAPRGMQPDQAATDNREYYRPHGFQGHPASGTNSPQGSHRYPPPAQPSQSQYQAQSGYPSSYGASQPPHGASPPQQYAVHSSASRSREVSQGGRDNAWPSPGHQQQPQGGGWPAQQQKTSQGPPQQQSWAGQHPSTAARPGTPGQAWSSAPPQQQHHMSMRDERMYGSSATSMSQQQHAMQSRYPPSTRAAEPIPPPSQSYPRYASATGPAPPRDPREGPGRSYTPGVYDARGPPPQQQGSGYPGQDPREMQLREARDPRDMMGRSLRPHDFDRHPDRYGR